jgi:hypothetical protein
MEALPADAFADSFGVNTHLNWWDSVQGSTASVYENIEQVAGALADLGCRHVRDAFPLDLVRGAVFPKVHELSGARFSFVTFWSCGPEELVEAARALGPSLEAIEGCNEPDNAPEVCPPAKVRDWQRVLAEEVQPQLPGVELLGTPMCFTRNAPEYGDMSMWMDVGNMHVYAIRQPYTAESLLHHWDEYRVSCGGLPVRVTETGYTTRGIHLKVNDRAAAGYLPVALLTNVANGIPRTYLYELVDEGSFVADEEYGQNTFGILTEQFEPKPSYLAIRDLMRLTADPGPSFDPEPLDVTVAGEGISTVLFQRRDGAYLLALWRTDSLYDPMTEQDLHPAPVVANVELAAPMMATAHVIGSGTEAQNLGEVQKIAIVVNAEAPTVVCLVS